MKNYELEPGWLDEDAPPLVAGMNELSSCVKDLARALRAILNTTVDSDASAEMEAIAKAGLSRHGELIRSLE